MKLPLIALIGRPNTGKSRLFNRLVGEKKAIVSDIAGTTRDRSMHIIEGKHPYVLMDTAGIVETGVDDLEVNVQQQTLLAINEADIIVYLIDRGVILPQDEKSILELKRHKKPFILLISKCDNGESPIDFPDVYSLGVDDIFCVSAVHKKGIDAFLGCIEGILQTLPTPHDEAITHSNAPNILFIGRPNTGKSSLVNAYTDSYRVVVSSQAGTTRDSIDTPLRYKGKEYTLIDTAGIRRRGKIEKGIEKWSLSRTLSHLDRTDICCLVIDASVGVTAQDAHVIEFIEHHGCGLILVVNKWDTKKNTEEERSAFLFSLKQHFSFLSWAPVHFVSATEKTGLEEVLVSVDSIMEERSKRIPTGKLNALISKLAQENPPKGTKRVAPKMFYITQTESAPPTFKLFVNKKMYFHFSYFRYLENSFREYFGFWGTPVKFDIEERKSIYQK